MDIWKIILAILTSMSVTAMLGPIVIPALRKLKFGQNILNDGPSWHKSKQGTPTMGGIMFILGTFVSFSILGCSYYIAGDTKALAVLVLALVNGAIGFCDDYTKIKKKRNLGLTAMQKIVLQVLSGAGFIIYLISQNALSTSILIPFTNKVLELGYAYYVLAFILLIGIVNAVNLTDGLDGLASSVTVPVMLFFILAATRQGAAAVTLLSGALLGGLFGFLIFNFYPAKIIMGDTGSLFLGGAVVGLAFSLNMPFVVLIAGIIYLVEAFSVILQVLVYKMTKKRIFKMAPIHHHFELCGWSEVKIVYIFTLVALVACIIAYMATGGIYNK